MYASYTTDILVLSFVQIANVLLKANQEKSKYYMVAKLYTTQGFYDNTTTTTILGYVGSNSSATQILPGLQEYNDTATVSNITRVLRSLASEKHLVDVPPTIDESSLITVGLALLPCETNGNYNGPN
ncbi:hypothetical protein SUGI_0961700 [Cryptomeria japonica]|nr:hypothetical protein SUGI_0961700 [Cryptomeria japonica]